MATPAEPSPANRSRLVRLLSALPAMLLLLALIGQVTPDRAVMLALLTYLQARPCALSSSGAEHGLSP
jgi:hypothetical protein